MLRTAFAILLIGAVATPQTVATPPPTIIREKVGPVCTTLHDLVLPLARMHTQFRQHIANITDSESRFKKYATDRIPTNMFAFKADMEATNAIQSIHREELLLIDSYRKYPQGKSPRVDALRQHVQNVVDLERAIANKYEYSFGTIGDNANLDVIQNASSGFGVPGGVVGTSMDPQGGPMEALVANPAPTPWPEMVGAPEAATIVPLPADDDPRISSTPPPGLRARMLKFYALGELNVGLKTEGQALIAQSLVAARDCDGVYGKAPNPHDG